MTATTPKQATPKFSSEQNALFMAELRALAGSLYDRWQDEKDYEDINDYAKVVAKKLKARPTWTMGVMTKRPFGFKFSTPGATYHVTATAGKLASKRIDK